MSKEKARYFTFLLYPESIPEDWLNELELLGVPIAISPLHDKDLSAVEGQKYKKPHYHVIYVSKNPVTAESVRLKIKRILGKNSVAKVQIVNYAIENMYLYLTHESKDAIAKNKQVYDKADIKHLNNFDIDRYITLDTSDKKEILRGIKDFIKKYGCRNIIDFERAYEVKGEEFGLPPLGQIDEVIDGHTGILRLYFDGVYQERKYGRTKLIDTTTGEVVKEQSVDEN